MNSLWIPDSVRLSYSVPTGIGRETIAVYVKIRVQCFGILLFTLLYSCLCTLTEEGLKPVPKSLIGFGRNVETLGFSRFLCNLVVEVNVEAEGFLVSFYHFLRIGCRYQGLVNIVVDLESDFDVAGADRRVFRVIGEVELITVDSPDFEVPLNIRVFEGALATGLTSEPFGLLNEFGGLDTAHTGTLSGGGGDNVLCHNLYFFEVKLKLFADTRSSRLPSANIVIRL